MHGQVSNTGHAVSSVTLDSIMQSGQKFLKRGSEHIWEFSAHLVGRVNLAENVGSLQNRITRAKYSLLKTWKVQKTIKVYGNNLTIIASGKGGIIMF